MVNPFEYGLYVSRGSAIPLAPGWVQTRIAAPSRRFGRCKLCCPGAEFENELIGNTAVKIL